MQAEPDIRLRDWLESFVRRFGKRPIVALILLIISVVIVGSTTLLPWWTFSRSTGETQGWYLGSMCSNGFCPGYDGVDPFRSIFGLTNALVLGALGSGIAALTLFVLSTFWPRMGMGALLAAYVGSLLILAAPISLYLTLPGAYNAGGPSVVTSFFGSFTQTGSFGSVTYTWGGGAGWYLAFVGFAVLLVSAPVAYSASRRLARQSNVRVSPLTTPAPSAGRPEMFCPVCGRHYPAGTRLCSRDATPLKQTA